MKLYALCDQEMLDRKGILLTDFIYLAKKNNAHIVQYRNKTAKTSFIKDQLLIIKSIYDGILVVNDKYELIDYCDGVHLGQEDLYRINSDISKAVSIVRNIIKKDKILGISTHNVAEVLVANELNLDYIGLGAFRTTSTKADVTTILGNTIEVIAQQSKHPVAAIGGVTLKDKFKNITYSVIGNGLVVQLEN